MKTFLRLGEKLRLNISHLKVCYHLVVFAARGSNENFKFGRKKSFVSQVINSFLMITKEDTKFELPTKILSIISSKLDVFQLNRLTIFGQSFDQTYNLIP